MRRGTDRDGEASVQRRGADILAVPTGSLGDWLRGQREARNVTLREIADSSKISMRYLEALEADRFDALPAPVFVRGFLREYARIVGLNSDEVVNVYLLAASDNKLERVPQAVDRSASIAARRSSFIVYGVVVAVILGILLLIAAAVSYWLGRKQLSDASGAPAVAETETQAEGLQTRPVSPGEGEFSLAADEAPPVELAAPVAEVRSRQSEPDVAAGSEAFIHVVLEFQQDCWVELVVDGRRRESELKAGGETWAIDAAEAVVITLGNAPVVRLEVNGLPYPLPDQGSRVVRDFRIDRELIAAAAGERAVPPGT